MTSYQPIVDEIAAIAQRHSDLGRHHVFLNPTHDGRLLCKDEP